MPTITNSRDIQSRNGKDVKIGAALSNVKFSNAVLRGVWYMVLRWYSNETAELACYYVLRNVQYSSVGDLRNDASAVEYRCSSAQYAWY